MKHDSTMNLHAAAACWRLWGSAPRPPGRSRVGPPAAARSSLAAGLETREYGRRDGRQGAQLGAPPLCRQLERRRRARARSAFRPLPLVSSVRGA